MRDQEEYISDYPGGRGRSRGAAVLMIVLALAIIAVLIYTYVRKKTTYTAFETTATYENIPGASCLRTVNGFILYNNDGAEGHDSDGRVKWKISYEFAGPVAAACGEYAAFADRGSNTVHVTGGNGANNVINVSGKIAGLCVAEQGVTAVRTDDGDSDHIYLYDVNGTMLLDIKTEVRKAGFPVAMALSPDGRKLVTSYIQAGQTQESWITFYNFGDVGQNYSDKIVGSYSFKDSFIPDIRFVGNERVLITGSDKCILYKFREVTEQIKEFTGNGTIASVASHGLNFILARKQNNGTTVITLYDNNGSEKMTVETGIAYDTVQTGNGELMLTSGDACVIYRKNGKEKFRAKLNGTISAIYPSGSDSVYTVVEDTRTEVIRLTAGSVKDESETPPTEPPSTTPDETPSPTP